MFPTYLLMKLQSYVKSIQEEEPEKGKEISLQIKSATGSISRAEFGSLLEYFKYDILSNLGTQVEVLKNNKIQEQQYEQD